MVMSGKVVHERFADGKEELVVVYEADGPNELIDIVPCVVRTLLPP